MEFKKIAIILTIIIGVIAFYKFVPTTIKKFIFATLIILTLFYLTINFLIKKTGGITQ